MERMKSYLRLLRIHQYVKNGFVFAPLFFVGAINDIASLTSVVIAFIAFCAAASSIYVLNDYLDIEEDREHPSKKRRPLAAGDLNPSSAIVAMGALWWVTGSLLWVLPFSVALTNCTHR